MRQMLHAAASDISTQTGNRVEFYVDTVGVGTSGLIQNVRYNCYLRVTANGYAYLLFQATTPASEPWPATLATPEGDKYPNIMDESELRDKLKTILQREKTKQVLAYLLTMAP